MYKNFPPFQYNVCFTFTVSDRLVRCTQAQLQVILTTSVVRNTTGTSYTVVDENYRNSRPVLVI